MDKCRDKNILIKIAKRKKEKKRKKKRSKYIHKEHVDQGQY